MKLYMIQYNDDCSGSGQSVVWVSSKRAAIREKARIKIDGYRDGCIYGPYEMILRKEEVLEYLNRHEDIG